MAGRRDNPYDDWDWLGIFPRDAQAGRGCLRYLPILLLFAFVLGIFVAPVWTFYYIGHGSYREKPWWLIVLSLPLTVLVCSAEVIAACSGSIHALTLVTGAEVQHNPFLITAMLLACGGLLVIVVAYVAGRCRAKIDQKLRRDSLESAAGEKTAKLRRNSLSPQPTRR